MPKAFITPDSQHFPSGAKNMHRNLLKSPLYMWFMNIQMYESTSMTYKMNWFNFSFVVKNTRYSQSFCTTRCFGYTSQITFEGQVWAKAGRFPDSLLTVRSRRSCYCL